MYHQYIIQDIYALPTMYVFFVWISEETAIISPLNITWLVYIAEI